MKSNGVAGRRRGRNLTTVGTAAVMSLGLLAAPAGWGGVFNWQPAVEIGDYEYPDNWIEAGAPTQAIDRVQFNTGSGHTVTFGDDWVITGARIGGAGAAGTDVLFDLQGNRWSLTSDDTGTNAALVVGGSTEAVAQITGGGTVEFGRLVLGEAASGDGTLIVSGAGTRLIGTNSVAEIVRWGQGQLIVSNQAAFQAKELSYNETMNTTGKVVVDGATAIVGVPDAPNSASRLTVSGELIIRNGGIFQFERTGGSDARIGSAGAQSTLLLVESGGQFQSASTPVMELAYMGDNQRVTVIVRDPGSVINPGQWSDVRFGNVAATNRQAALMVHTGGVFWITRDFIATATGDGNEWYTEVKGSNALLRVRDFFGGSALTLAVDRGEVQARDMTLDGSVLQVTLNPGGTNAVIKVTGTATLVNNPIFDLVLAYGFTSHIGETFTILAGTATGAFFDLGEGDTIRDPSGYEFAVSYASSFTLTTTAIPEPGILSLLALAGGLLLWRRRA